MAVPFHTPTVPGVALDAEPTTISLEKTNPQSNDSYQPNARGVHSKACTLIGLGSVKIAAMLGSSANVGRFFINVRASGLDEDSKAVLGTCGSIAEMIVRIVWSGSSKTHDSI